MKFVPGNHKKQLVPHIDTLEEANPMSRDQEIAVEVKEEDGVAVELRAGQASMHHSHLFHSSGPNTTDYRRAATGDSDKTRSELAVNEQ